MGAGDAMSQSNRRAMRQPGSKVQQYLPVIAQVPLARQDSSSG